MSNPYRGVIAKESPATASPHGEEDLEDLRRLLLAPERHKLGEMEERLDKLRIDAQTVAKILPDAIRHRSKQDKHLPYSLALIIGEILIRAVEKESSRKQIAKALSRMMRPAILEAITTALQDMMQRLDKIRDQSFSWQGLQWRVEARRTGKSFGEVVLLHTLLFRVEEVFLIHRESGLLLYHLYHPEVTSVGGHEEHVASMLTLTKKHIQMFVKDSFRAPKDDTLESFKTREGLLVLVEDGPEAVLAGVVRGIPPASLHSEFQEILDAIHAEFDDAFRNFQGDASGFEAASDHLKKCLKSEEKFKPLKESPRNLKKTSHIPWLFMAVLLVLIFLWVFVFTGHDRWKDFLNQVKKEPGLVVTSVKKENEKSVVYGFRDPLSADPSILAQKVGLELDSLVFEFEPYLALSPEIIEKRAKSLLHPPGSVALSVHQDNGKTILAATGSASHEWITRFRQIAEVIPGVTEINENDLRDTSVTGLEEFKKEIEAYQFHFERGSSSLSPEAKQEIGTLSAAVGKIDLLAQKLGKHIRLEIHGHTSKEGSLQTNRHLGLARAQTLATVLSIMHLKMTQIIPAGTEVDRSLLPEDNEETLSANRRVSLHVIVQDVEGQQ